MVVAWAALLGFLAGLFSFRVKSRGVRPAGGPRGRGWAVDRLDLLQMLLGHPEADVQVDFGDLLLDVRDVRYSADREAVVLLLYPADVRDVLHCPFRRDRAERPGRSEPVASWPGQSEPGASEPGARASPGASLGPGASRSGRRPARTPRAEPRRRWRNGSGLLGLEAEQVAAAAGRGVDEVVRLLVGEELVAGLAVGVGLAVDAADDRVRRFGRGAVDDLGVGLGGLALLGRDLALGRDAVADLGLLGLVGVEGAMTRRP